jgi:hypothetical protein
VCVSFNVANIEVRLFHLQDFVTITKEQAKTISKFPAMSSRNWTKQVIGLLGNIQSEIRKNTTTLLIPAVRWSLNVVVVSKDTFTDMLKSHNNPMQFQQEFSGRQMLFCYEKKSITLSRGVSISTWVLGDPQVIRTRVTYEYVEEFSAAYGSGYGSRPRTCSLDSINSYRDKRFNERPHPTPFVYDGDISKHQYYSDKQQKTCLLQMKLESILHNLANDATFVAERTSPFMTGVTSGLATKLIVTSGQSLFAFWNGLHVDPCDKMNDELKKLLFPCPHEEWIKRLLVFEGASFPTTLGYQHVWKNHSDATKYNVKQHFVKPGLGLGILLLDSICHRFMAGSFSHCTGLCILESLSNNSILCNNNDDIFRLFAWGNTVNNRSAIGNLGRENSLVNHRCRQKNNRGAADEDIEGDGRHPTRKRPKKP